MKKKKNNTTENNKLIAEFMGLTIITDEISFFDTNYKPLKKYHTDWNCLMEVVDKIEGLSKENETYSFSITKISVRVLYKGNRLIDLPIDNAKIEAVYNACIEFIKWYNKQK